MRTSVTEVFILTLFFLNMSAPSRAGDVTIEADSPMTPPDWALLERELIRANTNACRQFFARYFDERGYLLCVERWGGTPRIPSTAAIASSCSANGAPSSTTTPRVTKA